MTPHTAKLLHDAIAACDELRLYTDDWTHDEFVHTRSLQLIVWKLVDILRDSLYQAMETQPSLRAQIAGMVDVIRSMRRIGLGTGDVDADRLWRIVTYDVPELRRQLASAKQSGLSIPSPT